MTRLISVLVVLTVAAPAAADSAHDLFLCVAMHKNDVVGAKLAALSGVYVRGTGDVFQHLGSNFPGIVNLATDPRNRRVFYMATLNGCVQTADGGKTWRISTSWDMTEPKDVCVDPRAPDSVYLALPDGIAVSPDCGATWRRRETGLPDRGKYTQTIEVDRTIAGRVLAGCESGIYLTENGAESWRRVLATSATVDDVQQSPHDPKLWLAVTQSDGAHVSRDSGLTWERIAGVPAGGALYNLAFDATRPERIAIGGWGPGVLTSEDRGRTWSARNAGLPDDQHVFKVAVDPDTGRLLASLYQCGLYVSDDFGLTWTRGGLEGSIVYGFVFVPKATR